MTTLPFANRILILFGHPSFQKSRVNRHLVSAVRDLPGVTFHDLYEAYPEFDVDVPREQALLAEHDVIALHHPLFWYSTPPLVKQWTDLVLEHGWAYGSKGNALRGKRIMNVLTTGGSEDAYQGSSFNPYTLRQLLAPIEQTMKLCKMDYLPPFVVHGAHEMTAEEMERHADEYRTCIEALRDDPLGKH